MIKVLKIQMGCCSGKPPQIIKEQKEQGDPPQTLTDQSIKGNHKQKPQVIKATTDKNRQILQFNESLDAGQRRQQNNSQSQNPSNVCDDQIRFNANLQGIKDESQLVLIVQAFRNNDYNLVSEFITPKRWQMLLEKIQNKQQIYCRFDPQPSHQSNNQENTIEAVIIGPCGNGKTCLINHICGTDFAHGEGAHSVTRNVNQLEVQFSYNPKFIVYDTPGTTAIKDKLQHVVLLRQILTWKQYNCIFVLVKFNSRYDQIIKSICLQMRLLKGYEKSIVFLLSYFDRSETPDVAIATICNMLTELGIDNNVVFFTNKSCNKKKMADMLYSIGTSMKKVKIEIDINRFMQTFSIAAVGEEIYFQKDLKQADANMEELIAIFTDFALKLPNDEQKQSILQDLQIQLKNQLIQVLENFQNKFKETIVACEFYTSYYSLQKKIVDSATKFQKQIRSAEDFKTIESQATGQTDIRDLIKKCPNCGLIWMRIEECPYTICGNRPSCFFDFLKRGFSKFRFIRIGKTIQIERVINPFRQNQTEQNSFQQKIRRRNDRSIGCQQAINFQTLPRLPNIDQVLKQWYNVPTVEEANIQFLHEKDLQSARKKFEEEAQKILRGFTHK